MKHSLDISYSPLEEEEVEVVVALGKEVSENSSGVTRTNLIGRQTEVNTLNKVPELSNQVLIEASGGVDRERQRHRQNKVCFI